MTAEETQLHDALADAFPTPAAAPVQLHSQLAARAVEADAKRVRHLTRRRQIRLGSAWAGACGLALVLALAWPTVAAARALRQMTAAMEDARSAHITTWRVEENGQQKKMREQWYQDGKWRSETPREISIVRDGRCYVYAPAAKTLRVTPKSGGMAGYADGFALPAITRNVGLSNLRDLGQTTVDGQTVHELVVRIPNVGGRIVLYADVQTQRPFRYDLQIPERDGWRTEQTSELTYDTPLASRLFAADFPPGTEVINPAKEARQWQQTLARQIGRVTVDGKPVVLHDFSVNAVGDVFLLYAGGNFGGEDFPFFVPTPDGSRSRLTRLPPLELTDDRGTRYLPHSNSGGGPPSLQWWTPVTESRSLPHHFTLKFRTGWYFADPAEMARRSSVQAIWTWSVERPLPTALPVYFTAANVNAGLNGRHEIQVASEDTEIRAAYWKQKAGGDRAKLETALRLYHEKMQIDDEEARAMGSTGVNAEDWFAIYEILRDLGRRGEARDALDKAADQDVYHHLDKQIAEARRREGW